MVIKEIEKTLTDRGRGPDYAVHFVKLEDGGRGVWKPNITKDDKPGGPYKPDPTNVHLIVPLKEMLAYRIDKIIEAGLVPETEAHCHEGKWGVLQRFVENAVDGAIAFRKDNPRFKFNDMQKLGVLDFICSNPDRGPTNWLVKPDGSLVAIDNGGAFQSRDSFTWSTATIIGRPLCEAAKKLVHNAYDRIRDICHEILKVEYRPHNVLYSGINVFDVAAELAVNHTCVLAAAVGLTNDRYNIMGLVDCKRFGIDVEQRKKTWEAGHVKKAKDA